MDSVEHSHSHSNSQKKTLSILIIGAGIGGLSAAIALSHSLSLQNQDQSITIKILESKPQLNEFGASIGIDPQAVRIITETYNLAREFRECITAIGTIEIRDGASNEVLGGIVENRAHTAEIRYGMPMWNIHRKDYQCVLARGAMGRGVEILFGADVVRVEREMDTKTAVILRDGRRLCADLVVGADGLRSAVRASMPLPGVSGAPLIEFREQAFRCHVDKSLMKGHPTLDWLLTAGNSFCWTVPGRYVIGWPMPEDKDFDVVACVVRENDGIPPGVWGVRADPRAMAAEFSDFCPTVRDLLDRVAGPASCIQWRLAELPPLPTCRSPDGKTVLLGDAWHAMIPHAGSGGSAAIEDGAVLAECVAWAVANRKTIADATAAYEVLRKPRVERMQASAHEAADFLSAGGSTREMRDTLLAVRAVQDEKECARPEEERRRDPLPPSDMDAPYPSPPFLQWKYGVDVIKEAREYLATLA